MTIDLSVRLFQIKRIWMDLASKVDDFCDHEWLFIRLVNEKNASRTMSSVWPVSPLPCFSDSHFQCSGIRSAITLRREEVG